MTFCLKYAKADKSTDKNSKKYLCMQYCIAALLECHSQFDLKTGSNCYIVLVMYNNYN